MNIKEIMVGNWLRSVKHNIPVTFDLTDFYELCAMSDGATDDPPVDELFEPIPLTKYWLLRLGFIMEGNNGGFFNNYFTENRFGLVYCIKTTEYHKKGHFYHGQIGELEIEYVHQLQNLYFALTQQELSLSDTIMKP